MKVQRNQIVRRSKSQLGVQRQLDRFRMNRSFVCGFFKSGTCTAGDECLLSHSFPRNSNSHGLSDPGAEDAEQVGSGGFAWVKQNKDGGEVPSWFQRGFGSSELLGFDGRRGWDASNWGKASAVGCWGRASDGVSSWGNNYGGGGGSSWSSGGVNWGSWDFRNQCWWRLGKKKKYRSSFHFCDISEFLLSMLTTLLVKKKKVSFFLR